MTVTVHNWGGWELMAQAEQSAAFEWCTCDTGHCVPLILYRPIFTGINIRERWRMTRPRLAVRSSSTQEPRSTCLGFICSSFPRVRWVRVYEESVAAQRLSSPFLGKALDQQEMWQRSCRHQFAHKHSEGRCSIPHRQLALYSLFWLLAGKNRA